MSPILQLCAEVVPRIIERHGIVAHSCVLQSRIVIEVLKYFDTKAIPIPCNVLIYNPPLVQHLLKGTLPLTREELVALEDVDGSWNIGIGFGKDRPGFWGGHLIIGDSYNQWLMDTSIGQANRPQYSISLNPFVTEGTSDFLSGEPFLMQQNDCLLRYEACLENQRFQQGGDWRDKYRWNRLTGEVIREIRSQVT